MLLSPFTTPDYIWVGVLLWTAGEGWCLGLLVGSSEINIGPPYELKRL